ncbi:MAG: TerB family tellurite resistance protein [Bermanella sp.]
MFKRVLDWFKDEQQTEKSDANSPSRAAAALLLEVAFSDNDFSDTERAAMPNLLHQHTQLSLKECEELIEIAQQDVDHALSLHQFTHYLNEQFSLDQKLDLCTTLWKVAFADQYIDKYEDNMIRKIADLLHLRHSEFMQCKHKARAQS